jgi:serralysin
MYPVGNSVGDFYSDLWIDTDLASDTFIVGTEAYYVLLHEIGHTIGFDHPALPISEDNRQYTVMDYSSHPTMSGDVTGYQLYDIAAMQYLYGTNTSYATGNDVYGFSALDGVITTIWDAGGYDVIDMSGATYAVDLDLAGGAFSTVAATGSNNLAIAFGTVIEDAIGSDYNDRIVGNDAANRLTGGGGDDELTGRGGIDIFAFAGNWGNDTITDFVRDEDLLDFADAGLGFFDLTITSSGGDTLIAYLGDSVTLHGVATIDDSDFFVFVA